MFWIGAKYKVLLKLANDQWVIYRRDIDSLPESVKVLESALNSQIVHDGYSVMGGSIELENQQ